MRRFSYTAAMTKEFSAQRLDVKAFAQAGGRLAGHDSLLKYERLAQEAKGLHPDLMAMGDEFTHAGRREADAVFVVLDFPGDADAHGCCLADAGDGRSGAMWQK